MLNETCGKVVATCNAIVLFLCTLQLKFYKLLKVENAFATEPLQRGALIISFLCKLYLTTE